MDKAKMPAHINLSVIAEKNPVKNVSETTDVVGELVGVSKFSFTELEMSVAENKD